jgi:hypothetical protein
MKCFTNQVVFGLWVFKQNKNTELGFQEKLGGMVRVIWKSLCLHNSNTPLNHPLSSSATACNTQGQHTQLAQTKIPDLTVVLVWKASLMGH